MSARSVGTVLSHVRKLAAAYGAESATDCELLQAFADRQDQAAFAMLVRRHGPMVLNVCRRVLHQHHDAEDAFQATFLVLARKAASVRRSQALAGWLYGAAHRMALSMRRAAVRRRQHEAKVTGMASTNPSTELAWREVQALLEDEIQRLPEKYRMAFVLCCLEGKSRADAAGLLGVREGTLSSRLDQARKRLQSRLDRRGVSLSTVLAVAALTDPAKALGLSAITARAAVALAAGKAAAAGVISARVAGLVEQGSRALFTSKLKLAPLLLAACVAAAGAGLVAGQPFADPPLAGEPAQQPAPPAPPAEVTPGRTDVNGDPLPAEALARLGTLRFRPGSFIASLFFAPDGKTLVAQGADGTICVLNLATGRHVRRIQTGDGTRRRFSPMSDDGRWMILNPERVNGRIDTEAALELWDCTTGQKVRTFGKAPYISGLLSPDGKALAALRYDSVVEMWDPHTGHLVRSWKTQDEPGYDLYFRARFTADGKWLVTGHKGKVVRCWDVATGVRLHEFTNVLTTTLFAVSPQGVLAVDGTDYTAMRNTGGESTEARVRLFDVVTGKERQPLIARQKKNALGQPGWLMAGEFSPNGKLLATGGAEGLMRLWDVATGKELRSWPYAASSTGALRFSPDSRVLAVCDAGTTIRLYDVATGAETPSPPGHRSGFFQTAFSPDGKAVLILGQRTLQVWEAATGQLRRRREWPADQMASSHLSEDGSRIYSWANDHLVRIWDVATGEEVSRSPDKFDSPYFGGLMSSPDGKILALRPQAPTILVLALWPQAPTILLLDAATGRELRRLDAHAPWPSGAAFLPDGRSLVTWGADGMARVWEVATGKELRQIIFNDAPNPDLPAPPGAISMGAIYSTAVSPDGRLLAFGSPNQFIAIHDLASGKLVRRIDRLPDGVSGMAFSPDGRTLAWSGQGSSAVRLLEIASGQERHHFAGHLGRVLSLTFSADGRRLVSGSEDTTALVWDLAAIPLASSAKDREAAWADLAGPDAGLAYPAIRTLAATSAFFNSRLSPVAAVDERRVDRLIADLDRDDFTTRQKATAELEQLEEKAAAAFRKALTERPSVEQRRRLEALLDKVFQSACVMTPERLRAERSLEALELSGTLEAREVLEKLAGGAPGVRLTEEAKAALERLERRAKGR
jgi:RNA polymerase sigma factor (sigma-70 family)